MPSAFYTGVFLSVLGAIGFSAKAIVAKLAYRYGVDPITVLMYRMLFAGPIFALMAWWGSRNKPSLTWAQFKVLMLLGVSGYYLSSYLDFTGLLYISASLERLILYLNPTFVLIIGVWAFRYPISKNHIIGLLISYAGVVVVFFGEVQLDGWQTLGGSLLVLGAALSYALYLIISAENVKALGSMRLVGWATSIASVCCISHFLITMPLSALSVPTEVIGLSVINALFCTVIPIFCVMLAVEKIGASIASQVGMIGPMTTVVMGVFFLDEPFHLGVLLGTALVLFGVLWVGRLSRRAS